MALYEVEKGDSIWNIAEKSLAMQMPGQPLDPAQVAQEMQKIIGLNLKKLDDTPDLIHSGLVLDIGGSPTPGQAAEKGKNAKPSAYPDSEGVPPGGNIANQEQRPRGGEGGGRNLTDERNERILAVGSEPESLPSLNDGKRTFETPRPRPSMYPDSEGVPPGSNIAGPRSPQGPRSIIPGTGWNYQQPGRGMPTAPPAPWRQSRWPDSEGVPPGRNIAGSRIPSTGWNYQQPGRGMAQAPPRTSNARNLSDERDARLNGAR